MVDERRPQAQVGILVDDVLRQVHGGGIGVLEKLFLGRWTVDAL